MNFKFFIATLTLIPFSPLTAAIKARDGLNNRYFGGNRVSAAIYDQTLFDDHDLSG